MSWKPRSLILDLFGDYLRYAGGEIKLGEITELLAVFGMEPATVRVNMSRLRKEGWFTTRREGRETVYTLSAQMLEVLDEGRKRIFLRKVESWQGRWTMVIYQVPESERAVRAQLRKELAWHGFGQLSPSTWLAPHDLSDQARGLAANYPNAKMDVLWCGTGGSAQDRDLAARCWDLEQLSTDYREFIATYADLDDAMINASKDGHQALIERTGIVRDFRRFPFHDPQLPRELQPAEWPGRDAFELFCSVHRQLGPQANAFVSGIVGQPIRDPSEVRM